MIMNPIITYGGLGLGLLTILVSVYFTGRAIGQRSNGYVKQGTCDKNLSDLHDKFNAVVVSVAEIKVFLNKKL